MRCPASHSNRNKRSSDIFLYLFPVMADCGVPGGYCKYCLAPAFTVASHAKPLHTSAIYSQADRLLRTAEPGCSLCTNGQQRRPENKRIANRGWAYLISIRDHYITHGIMHHYIIMSPLDCPVRASFKRREPQ